MVRAAPKPNLRDASCCIVVVRNGAYGLAGVRLGLDRGDGERLVGERRGQRAGALLVEVDDVGVLERTVVAEARTGGDALAVDGEQAGRERARLVLLAGVERGLEVPVRRRAERHPGPLALDDEPRRHRLHAAGGQAAHDLLPEHRADLVAVQAVEDAAGLLGVDEVHVDVARVGHGALDRLAGDLVEDDALDRDLGLQLVEQVPGDGLALAVLICREHELVGVLEQLLELGDLRLLVGGHDVDRLEGVVDVDPEPRPRLALVLGGHLVGALRAGHGCGRRWSPRRSRRRDSPRCCGPCSATRR